MRRLSFYRAIVRLTLQGILERPLAGHGTPSASRIDIESKIGQTEVNPGAFRDTLWR
jgi:hypothetical protein